MTDATTPREVPATFGRRLVAFALDAAVIAIVTALIPGDDREWAPVVGLLYFWLWTAFLGRTPGKMALGLYVVSARGRMTLGPAFVREVIGKTVAFGTFFLGVLWIALDPQKRGWHDLFAGTRVLRVGPAAPETAARPGIVAAWREPAQRAVVVVLGAVALGAIASVAAIELEALSRAGLLPPALQAARMPIRYLAAISLGLLGMAALPRVARAAPAPEADELVVEPESFPAATKVIVLILGIAMMLAGGAALAGLVAGGWEVLTFVPVAGAFTVALLGGGAVVVAQVRPSLHGRPSRRLRTPYPWTFLLALVLVVAAGEASLRLRGEPDLSFAPLLLLGAALPPLAAVALAASSVGEPPSYRRMTLAAVAGGTLSVGAAIVLELVVPVLAAVLIAPIRDMLRDLAVLIEEQRFSDLLRSPGALLILAQLAVVAPLVEEAVKPIGVVILGRRIRRASDALLLGMACGAGFAIIENIMYEGGGLKLWTGVTIVRAVGGALHPFGAGLVALGIVGVVHAEHDAWRRLARNYLLAVGAHAIWNGVSGIFMLLESAHQGVLGPVDLRGVIMDAALLALLLAEGVILMLGVREIASRLSAGQPSIPAPAPARVLALWGIACMGVLLPAAVAAGQTILKYLGSALVR